MNAVTFRGFLRLIIHYTYVFIIYYWQLFITIEYYILQKSLSNKS